MGMSQKIMEGANVFNALMLIGFLGVVWLMLIGNMSGNLGFSSGTVGYNSTEGIIANLTEGAGTFFGFSNTLFTIMAIVILLSMLFGLLYIVLEVAKKFKTKGEGGFNE